MRPPIGYVAKSKRKPYYLRKSSSIFNNSRTGRLEAPSKTAAVAEDRFSEATQELKSRAPARSLTRLTSAKLGQRLAIDDKVDDRFNEQLVNP